MRDTQRERGRDTGRGRSRFHSESLTWDLIQGLQDHTLGWRQMLNHWATQVSWFLSIPQHPASTQWPCFWSERPLQWLAKFCSYRSRHYCLSHSHRPRYSWPQSTPWLLRGLSGKLFFLLPPVLSFFFFFFFYFFIFLFFSTCTILRHGDFFSEDIPVRSSNQLVPKPWPAS